MSTFDIGIIGGGLVGSLAALTLAQQGFSVVLFDPSIPNAIEGTPDLRVSAITPASWALLDQAGVTTKLNSERLSKILSMKVFEEASNPLQFYASEIGQLQLGWIIENNVLLKAIRENLPKNVTLIPAAVETIDPQQDVVNLTSKAKGKKPLVTAVKFLILAQGGNARFAAQLGIEYHTFDYQEAALVCHVESEQPHGHTAYQRFLPKPLAFLPLFKPNWSSIVWTCAREDAETLKNNPQLFIQRLTEAFPELGKLKLMSPVVSFPMYADRAKPVAGQRFILLGDAAHVVHPLAGQGVNLGFRDVMALLKVLADKDAHYLDDPSLVDHYTEATLKHNTRFSQGFSLVHYFYESSLLAPIRKLGTRYLNRFIPLKRELIKFAIGERFKP